MPEYEFTLKFRLPDADANTEQFIDALADAGCDDATVGVGQQGRIDPAFTREAANAADAILSAAQDVRAAVPGPELVEAAPDFVGLTDVAELVGCSRQNIRKLVVSNSATFPPVAPEGSQAFWHLRPALLCFSQTQKRTIDRALIDVSEVTMRMNVARQAHHLPGAALPEHLEALFT